MSVAEFIVYGILACSLTLVFAALFAAVVGLV